MVQLVPLGASSVSKSIKNHDSIRKGLDTGELLSLHTTYVRDSSDCFR